MSTTPPAQAEKFARMARAFIKQVEREKHACPTCGLLACKEVYASCPMGARA